MKSLIIILSNYFTGNTSSTGDKTQGKRGSARLKRVGILALLCFCLVGGLIGWRIQQVGASGTISGRVFQDFNGDGNYDTTATLTNNGVGAVSAPVDAGVASVTVTAYDSSGAQQGTATTATNGTYSLSAGGTGPYRIEFTNLPSGYYPSARNTDTPGSPTTGAGTTVQFVADGSTANVNFALSLPDEYAQSNPTLATSVFYHGDQVSGANNARLGLVSFPYAAGSNDTSTAATTTLFDAPTNHNLALPVNQIGSTFGLAYARSTNRLYAAAFFKKHASFGKGADNTLNTTDDPGAIYVVNPATNALVTTYTVPNATANAHNTADYNADNNNTGWDGVGKQSLGGMAISADDATLYVMNLENRNLYALNASTGAVITNRQVPLTPPGCPATGDVRPFAVKIYRGTGYIGMVCSAESTGLASDLRAYIYSFNLTDLTFSASPAFQMALNYPRGKASVLNLPGDAEWLAWKTVYTNINAGNRIVYPQPWLTGFSFDNGNLVLGLRDRLGDQTGINVPSNPALPATLYQPRISGDILRACGSVGAWTMESNGRCGGNGTAPQNTGQGPGSGVDPNGYGEFYFGDAYTYTNGTTIGAGSNHDEVSLGAMAQLPGAPDVVMNGYDPVLNVANEVHDAGPRWMNNTSGAITKGYRIYNGDTAGTGDFGKAAGLGDLVILADPAPLQIGNRVWHDANGNGRQDPGESAINSVAVQLWADTNSDGAADTQVGSATTDTNGNYYFGGNTNANMLTSGASCTGALAQRVFAGSDDAEQTGTTVTITGAPLELGRTSGNADNTVGVRFTGVTIPQGATVTSATLTFKADATTPGSGTTNVTVRGENVDNSATFTTGASNISSRATTTANAAWNIGTWTASSPSNATSPDLSAIVSAVVGRAGWASGNSLSFIISNNGTTGTNRRQAQDFNTNIADAPLLSVTYQFQCPYEVQPNTRYEVRVPATNFNAGQALNGYQLTQVNADTDANAIVDTNDDRRDSDGTFATVNGGGNSVLVAFNTGSAGQNDHTFDFGFRLATGNPVSLGNRVYLDNGGGTAANANNGTFDTGETGLAGVTLELFNSGGTTLLATTLTDANGYYSFPGLTSGSAYHVCVAASNFNSGGPLANYGSSTGNSTEGATTPDANTAADLRDKGTTMGTPGAGGFVETRVAVALTAGSAPTGEENGAGDTNPDNSHNLKVDFGFINYSLGNRVWLDNGAGGGVSNDGIINGSEAGISGVAVSLFADATCDGAIDTPSTPLATVTTDSNGYYRFDNLKTVCYIVRVNPSNFQTGGPLAARTNSAGNVNAGSNTTDSRDNGINNSNELTNGVLSNSINFATKAKPTGETNPGSYGSGATNGPAAADTADDLTVDFGFIIGAPSVVTLSDFAAYGDGATTLLQWRTGSETDNLGYFVYRRSGPGEAVRLNDEPIAGSAFKVAQGTTLTAGDLYYWRDQFVAGAEYYLEAVALDGKKQQFGPAPVKTDAAAVARAASAPNARLLSQLAANRAVTPTVPLLPKAVRSAMRLEFNDDALAQQRLLAAGPALQIGVKQSGWYRVSGAQLEAAGLEAVPDARLLQLYADGREVPCLVRAGREAGALGPDDTLEFYGFGLDERESDTRVYWLVNGARPGLRYGAPARSVTRGAENGGKDSASAPQSAANSFMNTVERRERSIYVPSIDNGEDTENFFGAIINRTPLNQTLELAQVDSAASATARLEVVLQGATPSAHRIRVQLNGQLLGFLEGNGKVLYSQRFDIVHSALNEGANTVTLNAEGDGDVSVVDYVRVVYARRYQAADNQLFFTLEARRSAQVGGFNTPNVRLFDFTEPERGYQVAAKVGSDAAGYTLSVEPGLRARALFAVSAANTLTPAFLRRNEASAWTTPEHQADFLIITPRAFRAAAQPLANVRSAQGLRTVVVNLEDIFDETTGGSKRVHALRYFLRYAQEKWQAGAQYALFLGDASVDARNYLALGDNDLVPTGYVSTVYLETMSDESLVDFNGDGLGEIAVGRLPARDLAQAQMLVGKTLGYQPRPLTDSALLVADRPDGYNFAQMNQQTAAALPAGTNATQLVRGTQPDAELRAVIFNALNQGPALVNFAGHGSTETWTGAPLLQRSDAAQLSNGGNQLSVYVMLTCLNGYFASATSESLAEGLINAPNGGAVAVWASTGLSAATGQQLAAREFYQRAYGATPYRLGDATRAAKAQTTDPDVRATWTLFADPTLLVR